MTEPDRTTYIMRRVDEIHEILTGNGDTDKGLVVRVAKLEQSSHLTGWLAKSAFGAAIAAFGTWVWQQITKGHA